LIVYHLRDEFRTYCSKIKKTHGRTVQINHFHVRKSKVIVSI